MAKKKQKQKQKGTKEPSADPRLDPSQRLVPSFDPVGIKLFPMADSREMGFRVLDNFAEEHQM